MHQFGPYIPLRSSFSCGISKTQAYAKGRLRNPCSSTVEYSLYYIDLISKALIFIVQTRCSIPDAWRPPLWRKSWIHSMLEVNKWQLLHSEENAKEQQHKMNIVSNILFKATTTSNKKYQNTYVGCFGHNSTPWRSFHMLFGQVYSYKSPTVIQPSMTSKSIETIVLVSQNVSLGVLRKRRFFHA